jgi:hypothetical protein
MTGIEIGIGIANRRTDGADDGYARAWTGGDGEKERERGKGKRRRAEHDEREEGRMRTMMHVLGKVHWRVFLCFFCSRSVRERRGVRGRMGDGAGAVAQEQMRCCSCVVSWCYCLPRLGGVVKLEPHAPLRCCPGAIRGGCRPYALRCVRLGWEQAQPTRLGESRDVSIVWQWCMRGTRGMRASLAPARAA